MIFKFYQIYNNILFIVSFFNIKKQNISTNIINSFSKCNSEYETKHIEFN